MLLAKEALEWTGRALERLELTLNAKKTSIRNARQERFDFLGYTFGPHISPRGGGRYMGYSPSKKSVNRIKQKVGELRHKVSSQGTRQFPAERVYGTLGVLGAPRTTGRAYVSLR